MSRENYDNAIDFLSNTFQAGLFTLSLARNPRSLTPSLQRLLDSGFGQWRHDCEAGRQRMHAVPAQGGRQTAGLVLHCG